MFNQYFGQYLLNTKKLTAQQLAEVMNYERSVRVKLGVLAVDAKFMTAKQVETVHHLQRLCDKRFGELAVDQGYLTCAQLEDLLENQHCRHLSLSQAILDKEYLTLAELEDVLADYKQKNQLTQKQLEESFTNDSDQINKEVLDFTEAGAQGKIYQDYIGVLQRNIIRFLDVDPVIGKNEKVRTASNKWLIYQKIVGEINLFTGIAMEDEALLAIARQYSGEVLPEIDELAKDSAAEFLNMVNGIFCVNASEQGIELDLQLQKIVQNEMPALENGYRIPINLSIGAIDVIVAAVE